jgi:hypothetical protein
MSQEPRAPTPAVYRTSPLYDVYGGTLYPYINHKLSGVTPFLSTFRVIQPLSKKLSLLSIHLPCNKFPLPKVLALLTSLERDGGDQM